MTSIELRGVRVHNLKGVDVAIPVGRLTVVIGVSGAGKKSLVFDTLFAEAQRRYLQSFSTSTRQLLERFDQPEADWIGDLPPAIAIRSSDGFGRADATLAEAIDAADAIANVFARHGVPDCPSCGQPVHRATVATVARDLQSLPSNTRIEIGFPDRPGNGESPDQWADRLREDGWFRLRLGDQRFRLGEDPAPPIANEQEAIVVVDRVEVGKTNAERWFETIETVFRRGDGRLIATFDGGESRFDGRGRCPKCQVPTATLEPRRFDCRDPLGACPTCHGGQPTPPCPTCQGRRFNALALSVRVRGRTIADCLSMSPHHLAEWLEESDFRDEPDVRHVLSRINMLATVGLDRIPLGRSTATLSSGEAQRLRSCRAAGVDLTGALYLFDEPTASLQPDDVRLVRDRLLALRDAGNTLVVIDHHPILWASADHLIELGPEAGSDGGEVVYHGSPKNLSRAERSISAEWIDDAEPKSPTPRSRIHGELRLMVADRSPFRGGEFVFPLGALCLVAGPSGAGKTRLLRDALLPALRGDSDHVVRGGSTLGDVVLFDPSPMTRSARANPATLLKIFDDVRELFAETTDARIQNLDAGAFSFNQPGGRCETCEGQGRLTVDMQFLADVATTCPDCLGRRYRREALTITVRGLNIADVLDLTARDAFRFFRLQRSIEKKLKWLLDVGLDYLTLGQPLDTLSTGESQRLRLAAHLAKSRKARTLFVLIEPTRGLHPSDTAGLLECFDQLLAAGHSLIVEDANPFVRRAADCVVEVRPC